MTPRFLFVRSGRALGVSVVCTGGLRAKGKRHLARDITVRRILGEGSFGQVFEGSIKTTNGEERVVLKRTKSQIPGAVEMSEMEHVLNVYASKVCRDSVADFIGYCGVNNEEATRTLTPGTWLLWRYQGDKTLANYMRRRDCIPALAQDLNVAEAEVPRTVLKQILMNLQGLHKAGLVHRDVKPSNLVLCEEDKTFKFIDLGACVDLRLGTNYVPDESILDAIYCPPEQYVLPTDAPHLSENALAMVISPMLWNKHKPDRFDVYSAGLIFFQLAVPSMCSDRAIKAFASSYKRHEYDLDKWRTGSHLLSRHTKILDAGDGAGWDLLSKMLKARKVERSSDGTVSFVDSSDGTLRISVEAALNHDFFTAPVMESGEAPLLNLWQKYSRKLFDLEGRILDQVFETEQQTTTVKKLRSQVEKGEVDKAELVKEEKKLNTLQAGLKGMTKEFVSISKTAFDKFGVKKKVSESSEEIVESIDEDSTFIEPPAVQSKPLFSWLRRKPSSNSEDSHALNAAENLVYMGLKFTGLAARVAGDLARSVKDDAEKLIVEIEQETNQKRKQQTTDRQFLELLKESKIELKTQYEDLEARLGQDSRYQGLTETRKRILFSAYIKALEDKEKQVQKQAEEKLRSLYMDLDLKDGNHWKMIAQDLSENPVFLLVQDPSARHRIFKEVLLEQQKATALQRAQMKAESDFKSLLKELRDPPISGVSTWPRVKQQIFADVRYQAVEEKRKMVLFEEYRNIVREIEREAQEAIRVSELKTLKERASRETAAAEQRLSELKNERQRLKEEYEKMQMNLKAMESKLASQREALTAKQQLSQKENDDGVLVKSDSSSSSE